MNKRILSMVLVLTLLLTLLPTSALAAGVVANGSCGGSVKWSLSDDGVLTLSGSGATADYDYYVKDTSDTPAPWFEYRDQITSIVVGTGITELGQEIFACMTSVVSISLPNTLKTIGPGVFDECFALKSITIPASVTTFPKLTYWYDEYDVRFFAGCTALEEINVAAGNPNFASVDGCLYNKDVTELVRVAPAKQGTVTIPDTVTTVAENAFSDMQATGLVLSDGITEISYSMFSSCKNLTSVEFGENLTTIGRYAFNGCSALAEVTFNDKLETIDTEAFSYCSSLTELTFPTSLTSISGKAFYYCTSLSKITFLGGTCLIGNDAFSNHADQLNVYFMADSDWDIDDLKETFRYANETVQPVSNATSGTCGENATWTLEAGKLIIAGFGPMADYNTIYRAAGQVYAPWYGDLNPVTSVIVEEGITSIGNSAFMNCNQITNVSLPSTLTSIGNNAFYGLTLLEEIQIPAAVTSIGDYAFADCTGLTQVVLPESVTSFGIYGNTFLRCTNLKTINIPNGVTRLPSSLFDGCSSLEEITIPASVTIIGGSAFYRCTSLESVTIPASVEKLGSSAFRGCSGLKTITFLGNWPEVDSPGMWSGRPFRDVTADLYIPAMDATWGGDSIEWLDGELTLHFLNEEELNLVACGTEGNGNIWMLDSNGVLIIYGSGKLDHWNSFSKYAWADYAEQIREVVILQGITFIPQTAFSGCSNLTSVTIPASVTEIGGGAFYCESLTEITFKGNKPEWKYNSFCFAANPNIYYPENNETWAEIITTENSYGTITWIPYTAACEHDWSETDEIPATCTTDGELTLTCSLCGETQTETIYATGHDERFVMGYDAGCFEDGLTDGSYCTICDEVLTEQEVLPALGHEESYDAAVKPTCTAPGWTEGSHCSRCGEVFQEQKEIPMIDHSKVAVLGVDPTCTKDGLTEGLACDQCGEEFVNQEPIPATGHDWTGWVTTIEPTEEVKGEAERKCAVCGEIETKEVEYVAYKLGDVNGDGKLNAKDATAILKKIVGKLENPIENFDLIADVNKDGKVNAKDATKILKTIVKKDTIEGWE